MATEVLTPIADGPTVPSWTVQPTSPATRFDKVDEGHMTPDYADYVYTTANLRVLDLVFSVPLTRNIDAVSNVRVYFPFWGQLGTSTSVALKIDVYGNGVLKGTITVNANTGGTPVLAYVDVPVSGFSQAEADAIRILGTCLVNAGGSPPGPDVYVIP